MTHEWRAEVEPPFESFPKIPRLMRDVVVTEKLDGTNASVVIDDDGRLVRVASKNRWITPGKSSDNAGFAAHVHENKAAFEALGPGRHFGEWWGQGIQRGYGLDHKRFSLFNTGKWNIWNVPEGIYVVPVLAQGGIDVIPNAADMLNNFGSIAAPGFLKPEGIIIFHTSLNGYFKFTLDGDGHKGVG